MTNQHQFTPVHCKKCKILVSTKGLKKHHGYCVKCWCTKEIKSKFQNPKNQIPTRAEKIRQNAIKPAVDPLYKYSKVCSKCLKRFDTDFKRTNTCWFCGSYKNSGFRQRRLKWKL